MSSTLMAQARMFISEAGITPKDLMLLAHALHTEDKAAALVPMRSASVKVGDTVCYRPLYEQNVAESKVLKVQPFALVNGDLTLGPKGAQLLLENGQTIDAKTAVVLLPEVGSDAAMEGNPTNETFQAFLCEVFPDKELQAFLVERLCRSLNVSGVRHEACLD